MIEIRRRMGISNGREVDTTIDDVWLVDDVAFPNGVRVGFLDAAGSGAYFCERFISESVFADVVRAIVERDGGKVIARSVEYMPGADYGVDRSKLVRRIGEATVCGSRDSDVRDDPNTVDDGRRTRKSRSGGGD